MLSKRQDSPLSANILLKEHQVSKNTSTSKIKSLEEDKALKNTSIELLEAELLDINSDEYENTSLDKSIKVIDGLIATEANIIEDESEDAIDYEDEDSDLSMNSDIEFELLDDDEVIFESQSENLPQVSNTRLPKAFVKDNLQMYLREISAFPILKPEEELELTKRIQESNDPDAAFRLVSSHLRLVVKIAMEFQRRWMQNVLDLVQEGNIGLVRAVNKFDPDKGIKFSYYAKFWIRAYILKFIMDNWRMVKIGTTQAQRKLFYNLNKEKQKLIAQGFDPNIEVLAEKLNVTEHEILEMEQRLEASDMSLDAPVSDESGSSTKLDYLPALIQGIEDGYAENEINSIIQEKINLLIPNLTDKELFILENRLLTDEPITLREIGEKYNVTRERIRQLEARLVNKVRIHLTSEIEDFSEDWIQH